MKTEFSTLPAWNRIDFVFRNSANRRFLISTISSFYLQRGQANFSVLHLSSTRSNFQEISSRLLSSWTSLSSQHFLSSQSSFIPATTWRLFFQNFPSFITSIALRIDLRFLFPSFPNLPLSFFIHSLVSYKDLNFFNLRFFFFLALLAKFKTKRCLRSFFEFFLFHACFYPVAEQN